MKKIIEIVREKKARMKADPVEAGQNQVLSQAAIIGGIQSTAWKTYMLQFVDQTVDFDAQITRLTAKDGTADNPGFSRNRAYLVANGMCGEGTRDRFDENVEGIDAQIQ